MVGLSVGPDAAPTAIRAPRLPSLAGPTVSPSHHPSIIPPHTLPVIVHPHPALKGPNTCATRLSRGQQVGSGAQCGASRVCC